MARAAAPAEAPILERALHHDRVVVCVALCVLVVTSWVYLLAGAGMSQDGMHAVAGTAAPARWTPSHALLMLFMWWVMMVAMMLPGAAPVILLFAVVNRKQRRRGEAHVPTALFAGAYLAIWGAFSLVATMAQWALQEMDWLSSQLVSRSATLSGVLMLLAGIYQLTPLKQACLRHCRSPLRLVAGHWRPGLDAALRMGMKHGAYCVGCCWLLMALLFAGGVMNPWWILGLSLFVLLEKTVPAGHWLGRGTGLALVAAGAWLLGAGIA